MTFALAPLRRPLLAGLAVSLLSLVSLASLSSLAGCGGGGTGGDGGDGGGGGTGGAPEPKYEPFAASAQTWSHGEPTALEQALLEEIQRARGNPKAELDIVLAVPGVEGAMAQFETDEKQLEVDFATYFRVPPLSFDPQLMASARFHSEDMAKNGFQEHDGSAGESFVDRIEDAGYKWDDLAENIFAYADNVPYCHAAFMIDWGNTEPGHREAILDIGGIKRDVGISIIEMPQSPEVGPLVVTQDFGAPESPPANAQKYIVGVAYDDLNGNGKYDPGEGLEGLRVIPEKGDFWALTSVSGGFSVPMPAEAGAVKVQIQDSSTFVLDQKIATLQGDNVKVDFRLPAD